MDYLELLHQLHEELRPAGYLEIGVDWGASLRLSRARSVAIDPAPKPLPESLLGKQGLMLYVGTSDDFFRDVQRESMLGAARLDLVFIDGLHEFAQVVRDLEHIERWGHAGTVVAIHDVLPRNAWEAAPAFHDGFWTGDVWRVVPFLREHRPDLRCWLTEAEPTGLLIVTALDPGHPGMAHLAEAQDATSPPPGPEYDRLVKAFIAGAVAEPAEHVLRAVRHAHAVEREWEYDARWGMRTIVETSWRPLLEAAEAHHPSQDEHGLRACLRLIGAHWLPDGVREQAYEHLTHYASSLETRWPGASWATLSVPETQDRAMISPSPAIVSGNLVATVQNPAADGTGLIWSLLMVDRDLRVLEVTPLKDETRSIEGAPDAGSSIEQLQLFVHDERLYAIVTVGDRNRHGVAQAGLAAIADGALQDLRPLSDAANGRHERDWAPLPTEAGLYIVSCWEPTETLRVDLTPGSGSEAVSRIALRPAPRLAERFQGVSAGIAVPDGALYLVNERAGATGQGEPLVFARFVFVSPDFRVMAVSPHFWVSARGLDVASGLTRAGKDLIAGFTSPGEGALLARIPLPAVLASLLPLDSAGSSVAAVGAE